LSLLLVKGESREADMFFTLSGSNILISGWWKRTLLGAI